MCSLPIGVFDLKSNKSIHFTFFELLKNAMRRKIGEIVQYLYIQRNRNGQALDHKSQIWNNNNLDYFHHIRLAETHENVCSLR